MRKIGEIARSIREGQRTRRAKLLWCELEAEAARQRRSPADIFFDRAVARGSRHLSGQQAQQHPDTCKERAPTEVGDGGESETRDGGEAGSGSYRTTQE
jgi:hypothetical protein